jgi:hypothetical protein
MKSIHLHSILQSSVLACSLIICTTAWSQQSRVFWIGPGEACDHATIQEALGSSAGQQPRDELRLSLHYRHSGTARLAAGLHVRGGFEGCKGRHSGTYTNLHAPATQPLFVLESGSENASSTFANLRLFGDNFGPRKGGVIRMERGTANLVLDNVIIRNGSANEGGAIYMAGGNNRLELRDTQLTANEASMGGGIYCADGSTVTLLSGRIEGNTAQFAGGGLFAQPGCEVVAEPARLARIVVGNRVQDQEIAGLVR